MRQSEVETFARNSGPRRNDKITKLLYSHDPLLVNLASTTLLGKGKSFCEEYLDYCAKEWFTLCWGNPILLISKEINIGILIIDWIATSEDFPTRTCHLVSERLCKKVDELTLRWSDPIITEF